MGSDAVPRKQYLWKRGGRYYVRRRVPTHLVPFIGKAELTSSLHTSDYVEALKRADLEIAQMRLAFDKAEAALALAENTSPNKLERLSFSEIDTLVRDWFDRSKRDLLENWSFRATGFNEAGEDMEAMREETLAGIEDRLRREAISDGRSEPDKTQSVADELLIREGFAARARKFGRTGRIALVTSPRAEVDEQSAKYRHLIACVREAHVELLRFHRSILVGADLDHHQVSPLPERGITLDELIDAFLDDPRKKGISEKRRIDYGMVFRILRETLGGEKLVRDITREDFRMVGKLIRTIPKNCTKLFPGVSFSDAARRAEVEGLQRLNPKTVTTHLQKVSTLFRWAENEDYVTRNLARGLSDPGAGIHRKGDRHPFSGGDLQKIFSAQYGRWSAPSSHELKSARFWVPLIALFHGMRLNEICQLSLEQVKQETTVWYFDIYASSDRQRLKTEHSRRQVPLHSELIKLGLLDHVSWLRERGEARLFPELSLDRRGYHSRKLTRWFGNYLASCGVKSEGKSFHSFRHTWRDAARANGIADEVAEAIGGWARRNTASRYGSGYSLEFLNHELEKIRYPCLDLGHLC